MIGLRVESEPIQFVVPISFEVVTDGLVVVGSRDQFGGRVWMESRSAGVIFFGARRNSEIESWTADISTSPLGNTCELSTHRESSSDYEPLGIVFII